MINGGSGTSSVPHPPLIKARGPAPVGLIHVGKQLPIRPHPTYPPPTKRDSDVKRGRPPGVAKATFATPEVPKVAFATPKRQLRDFAGALP